MLQGGNLFSYTQGPLTIYGNEENSLEDDIVIRDQSTDSVTLTIFTPEKEKEIFFTDE